VGVLLFTSSCLDRSTSVVSRARSSRMTVPRRSLRRSAVRSRPRWSRACRRLGSCPAWG